MHVGRLIALALTVSLLSLPVSLTPAAAAAAHVHVLHPAVRPGERQTVVIQGLGAASYPLNITLPDGETLSGSSRIDPTSKRNQWSFMQPPDSITHGSRRAVVHLLMGSQSYATSYIISFDILDVVAPRGSVPENSELALWVHAQPRTHIAVQVLSTGTTMARTLVTGRRGWALLRTRISNDNYPFQPMAVSFVASVNTDRGRRVARADFQVLPFQFQVSLQNVQILHRVGDMWVQTADAHLGEVIRMEARSIITEPAGQMAQCVSGYVTITQAYNTIQMAPLRCAAGNSYEIMAEVQLSPQLAPGPAQMEVDAFYGTGTAHLLVPFMVANGRAAVPGEMPAGSFGSGGLMFEGSKRR